MQSSALIMICISTTFTVSNSLVNYCGSKMCGYDDSHTFCQYPEGPSPICMGYISASLSEDEKLRLIARLNRRRNATAAGQLGLASAGDMMKLLWVEELAREAQRWADQCRPPQVPEEHDTCRDLYSVEVGQCVASVVGDAPGLRVETMVDIWYMQNILYKGNATVYVPPANGTGFYGDFAQIMWSQTFMVGCARARFMTEWRGRFESVVRLVCNLAPSGPPPGRPLWSPSAPAAMCPPGSSQDTTFEALCGSQLDRTEISGSSMPLDEEFLLYTVLDTENNASLRYPGSLDELYLTKIAMTTIGNITEKPKHSNLQRRAVVQMDIVDNNTISCNISYSENKTSPVIIQTTVKNTKIKGFIGRPKPYDLDELSNVNYIKENNSSTFEDLTEKEKNIYNEYEFEPIEDNSTDSETFANAIESLTDEETTQELEEALDSGERKLSIKSVIDYEQKDHEERRLKVRRELRDMTEDDTFLPTGMIPNIFTENKNNQALNNNQMYDMMRKYMPYLRKYQAGLFSKATNSASSLCPSLILVLSMFSFIYHFI